jgi:putative ABC transport system ATP-binding protein
MPPVARNLPSAFCALAEPRRAPHQAAVALLPETWDVKIPRRWRSSFSGSSVDFILKTEELWKVYHAGSVEVPALRGVNLDVPHGRFLSIMGPSGCGKSTLLYVIGGLARASRGRVFIDGNDLATMSDAERTKLRRNKIGFVFQKYNLLPTLDAYGNIAIAQHIAGDGFDPHRFEVVVKMLGLADRLKHKPSEMSGGEQQRVAIARAIINEPKILLADEPTGNLDTRNSETVLAMLRQLNKEFGQTIVMITHNPDAAAYGDSVVHMRDGIIVDGVPPN